jgi:hypothetical protein
MSEQAKNAATEFSADALSTDLRRVRDRLLKVRAAIAAAGARSPSAVGEVADHLKQDRTEAVSESSLTPPTAPAPESSPRPCGC